jgi:MSHA biogenesis protein MshP
VTPAASASRQGGVVLIAALFLIVVLAGLGIFAIRLGASQQQSVDLAVLAVRAQAAANSGLEWGAYTALSPGGSCTSTVTVPLTEAALTGFTVTVACSHSTHTVGAVIYDVYRLDSVAQAGIYGAPAYVARTATRTVSASH